MSLTKRNQLDLTRAEQVNAGADAETNLSRGLLGCRAKQAALPCQQELAGVLWSCAVRD